LLLPVASSVNRPVDTSAEPLNDESMIDEVPTDIPEVTITPEPIIEPTAETAVLTPTVSLEEGVGITDTTTLTDTTVLTDTIDAGATTPEPTAEPEAETTPEPTTVSSGVEPTLIPAPTEPVGLRVYAVEAGDSLGSIADKFKVSVKQIMAVNPYLQNPDALLVGQELNIP
jgi:peptidoglycan endopeptidase LytE